MSMNLFKYLRERHALVSVIYYILTIPTVIFFITMPQFNDGGPCNPGTNLAVFMLAIMVTLILFCIYSVKLIRKGRTYRLPFLIHLGAVIVIFFMMIISSMMAK